MSIIAEVRVADSDVILTRAISRNPGIRLELDYQVTNGSGSCYVFFEAHGDEFDEFEADLDAESTVIENTVIVESSNRRVYRLRLDSSDCSLLPKTADLGIRVLHAVSGDSGWIAKLEFPEMDVLQRFREYCEDLGIDFAVRRLYQPEGDDSAADVGEFGLTPAQREVLLEAYRVGYFDEPRGASLVDVAESLDISSSAAGGRLRRAMRNVVENGLGGDR